MPDEQGKKTPQELKRELEKIYADPEGKLPDFTRLDGKPGSRLKSAIVGMLAALAVVAAVSWAGIFFFSRTAGFTGEGVEVRIESAERLPAGDESEIVVRWKNEESVPLARAVLRLKAPKGFEITGSQPPLPDSGEWAVGSVPPGGEGEVRLKGVARREPDAALTFEARLDYKPADFNSDFEKVASHTVVVGPSPLTLKASGPEQMTPGDEAAFVFEYGNASQRAFEGVRFSVDPLEGFIPSTSDPASDPDVALRWTLPRVEPGAKGLITVRGTFSATSRGPKTLTGRIGQVEEDVLVAYASAGAATEVLKSDLALSLIVNGSAAPTAASFGDTLFYTLNYENAGDVPLREVTLSADLAADPASDLVDWVSLKDELEGKRVGSTLIWTKSQVEGLAQLAPGDKGSLNFSVQLARRPPALQGSATSTRFAVRSQASARIGRAGSSGAREVSTAPVDVRLRSDAAFKAFGRYFTEDGAPLGSGPLPPKAGEKTVYRINWVVQNTLHELTNLSATTLLPQGVRWTGVERPVDAGELSFDETGRKVTWRLNRMPTSVQAISVTFDVEYAPAFEDVGKIADLTGDNRFEAFDKEVETVILKTEPPVGTDLLGDEHAAGKGVVRE